ncbi:MAG TPA: nuclear transport factor 2 family protein [Polyangiaceae bacterium]|nr:nuclear transport factor 2 family protein [Polyangiaceae bacterium]
MERGTAGSVARAFFDAYRARDVEAMVAVCSERAGFHYVPFEVWGKQRVLRGDGNVRGIGKVLWTGLIESFPDLTNEITSMHADDDGNVAVEATICGTQAKSWGAVDSRGRSFAVRHLFLLHVAHDGLIDQITAYWDSADFNRQLGRLEID